MTQRTKFLIAAFLIVLAIIGLYYSSLHFDFSSLDDNELVVRNPDIKALSLDRIQRLFTRPYITLYVPLTMLSYSIDYEIWRLTSFGFRFTNVVLHFLNALMVLSLVRLFHRNWLFAFSVALIFSIHPVQIESVVWISERKNLLSAFFLLCAFTSYWKAGKPGDSSAQLGGRKWLMLSFFFYFAGLLSKPSVVIFLPLVFALNLFVFEGSFAFKKRLWFYSALVLMAIGSTAATIAGTAADMEHYSFHGGSYQTNLLVMASVFLRYLNLIFFPYTQNILYSSPKFTSFLDLPVLWSLVSMMFFVLLFLISYRQKNLLACFWLSWYVLALLPVSNLLAPLPSIMNDRYLYVPLIGFFSALFAILEHWSKGLFFSSQRTGAKIITGSLIFCFVFPFSVLSVQRLPDWKNPTTLWSAAFERSPRKDPRIFYFSGINQIDLGNYERAVELFEASLKLDPTIDTRLALGTAYVAAKKFGEAENHLKKVIELDPGRAGAYDQLGAAYRQTNRYKEAEEAFQKALQLQPRTAVIYNNYALLKMDVGRPAEARQNWEYALKLDPDCHFALRNLSWFYFMRDEWDKAVPYLLRYLRRDPTDAQMLDMAKKIQNRLDTTQ